MATAMFQSAVRIAVWLKPVDSAYWSFVAVVSIRRADRCLVEADAYFLTQYNGEFQSAVRIAVWLKETFIIVVPNDKGFNPPCGSLFG